MGMYYGKLDESVRPNKFKPTGKMLTTILAAYHYHLTTLPPKTRSIIESMTLEDLSRILFVDDEKQIKPSDLLHTTLTRYQHSLKQLTNYLLWFAGFKEELDSPNEKYFEKLYHYLFHALVYPSESGDTDLYRVKTNSDYEYLINHGGSFD